MDERARKIAAGLAAAEKAKKDLASPRSAPRTSCAKHANAPRRSSIRRSNAPTTWWKRPRARPQPKAHGCWLQAHEQIDARGQRMRARAAARKSARSPSSAASQMLEREIDPHAHAELIDKLAARDLASAWLNRRTIARPYAKAAFQEAQADKASVALVRTGCARPPRSCAIRACTRCSAARASAAKTWSALVDGCYRRRAR